MVLNSPVESVWYMKFLLQANKRSARLITALKTIDRMNKSRAWYTCTECWLHICIKPLFQSLVGVVSGNSNGNCYVLYVHVLQYRSILLWGELNVQKNQVSFHFKVGFFKLVETRTLKLGKNN